MYSLPVDERNSRGVPDTVLLRVEARAVDLPTDGRRHMNRLPMTADDMLCRHQPIYKYI
jgi:hypothetical protein